MDPLELLLKKDQFSKQNKIINLTLPEEFISLANKDLPSSSIEPLTYIIKDRGLSKNDIIRWRIGYCSSGFYENRIVFPSFNYEAKLNFFTTRSYNKRTWPKYKNPQTSNKDIIFNEIDLVDDQILTITERYL